MALILNIETATTNCSVSVSKNGDVLNLIEDFNSNFSHAESLHVFIEEAIKNSNIALSDLDAISVSMGPGSYTGLRIGVSAAKGLCFALDVPLIAISTLESLAHQVKVDNGIIIPMLDARRLEVYTAVFNNDFELIRETQAQILDKDIYKNYLELNRVYFIGSGVEKSKQIILHENAVFIENKLPSANELAKLSEQKFMNKDFEDLAYFEPFYLKEFIGNKA